MNPARRIGVAIEHDAREALRRLAGHGADFRPGQLEAIRSLVAGERSLVVQRTGWGKSAVYFIATHLLRQQGRGPTLVISPLLVLMRNQVEAAQRLGLVALTLNSTVTGNERNQAHAAVPTADMIFVTPESLHSRWFGPDVLSRLDRDPSAVVIDEVHCISEWGHNFRPKYRRIRDFLDRLPRGVGVMGTTATASERTIIDIEDQLGDSLTTIRGPLARESLRLHVTPPASQPLRLAWLATFIERQLGAGIVYVLTIHDAERVAKWLGSRGIDAVSYTGAAEDETRRRIEERLTANDVQAVVATTALGMGYDKPDLRWVVHFQLPAGAVSYYQQVGRAGRGVDAALGMLLRGHDDRDIHEWFIETAYPGEELTRHLLAVLDQTDEGLTKNGLLAKVNIRSSRLDTALVILTDEGVVELAGSRYYRTVKPYEYPRDRVAEVAAARRREFEILERYADGESCLMEMLQLALDDRTAEPCGRCGPCTGETVSLDSDPALVRAATQFLWRQSDVLEVRKRWPNGGQLPVGGAISVDGRPEEGRVLGRYQDGGYGDEALSSRSAGTPSAKLLEGLGDLLEEWDFQYRPRWVSWVPSNQHDPFLRQLAGEIANSLGLACEEILQKRENATPQQAMQNSQQAALNAWRNLAVRAETLPAGPVLLLDDVTNTRWTMTVAAYKLREAGGGPVLPLVLCALPSGAT